LRRIFDRKISDRKITGYNAEEIKKWLSNVKEIDSFKYYYYPPSSKFPAESKNLRNQPAGEVLSFLDTHFTETSDLFVEIQLKVYKSGMREIIFRGMNSNGEITKIAVLNLKNIKGNDC